MTGSAQLYLPPGYRENPPLATDTEGGAYWADPEETEVRNRRRYQDAVYRIAARRARHKRVLDVGCGTGQNLVRRVGRVTVGTVGVDQPSAIEMARRAYPDREWIAGDLGADEIWERLRALAPDVVICADVIEHVPDPRELLDRLRGLLDPSGTLVLSTPDRARTEDQAALGPPRNPRHVREWTRPEMQRLLESTGFAIRSSRHVLPRRYPPTVVEAKILVWRALHLRPIPGRRSCMVFELSGA
jgi:trans-aconitate methyltransferase